MQRQIVLVIRFGRIKLLAVFNPCRNRLPEHMGCIELGDIRLCHLMLLGVLGKNRGTILGTAVRP